MISNDFYKLFDSDEISDESLLNFSKNMLNRKNEIPPLYRYSSADYYNIRGLETQSIHLSSIGSMNDIFEGLSCEITDKILSALDKINDIAYIKSFSESKDNLLMWAHYANSYSGMCVEYDFSKIKDDMLIHLFPVMYSEKRFPKQELERAIKEFRKLKRFNESQESPYDMFFIKDIMYLLLTKSNDWSYEKEWRFIAMYYQVFNEAEEMENEECADFYRLDSLKIPVENSIKAVYLGARMKWDIQEHIIEICKRIGGIKVYRTKLSTNKYELESSEVDI